MQSPRRRERAGGFDLFHGPSPQDSQRAGSKPALSHIAGGQSKGLLGPCRVAAGPSLGDPKRIPVDFRQTPGRPDPTSTCWHQAVRQGDPTRDSTNLHIIRGRRRQTEGIEGIKSSGRSALAKLLHDRMNSKGIPAVFVQEPGSTPLGEHLRSYIKEHKRNDHNRGTASTGSRQGRAGRHRHQARAGPRQLRHRRPLHGLNIRSPSVRPRHQPRHHPIAQRHRNPGTHPGPHVSNTTGPRKRCTKSHRHLVRKPTARFLRQGIKGLPPTSEDQPPPDLRPGRPNHPPGSIRPSMADRHGEPVKEITSSKSIGHALPNNLPRLTAFENQIHEPTGSC